MSGFLSADAVAMLLHLQGDIFIAHRSSLHADPLSLQRLFHAHVGGDGGDYGVIDQRMLFLHVYRTQIHNQIAVKHISQFIHGKTSVRVPVKSKAYIQAFFHHKFLQGFNMGGTAVHIDIQSVRFVMKHVGLRAQHLKYGFCYTACRSVCTVQPHFISPEGMDRGGGQITDILVSSLYIICNLADIFISGTGDFHLSVQVFFHFFQNGIFHFEAVLVYDFNAVVVKRIMAGGDHDAEIKIPAFCYIRYTRCGSDMQQVHIHAAGA